MLVLSRHPQEAVIIRVPPSTEERTIRVMLTEIRRDKARLGFEADRDIEFVREELLTESTSDAAPVG